MSELILFGVGVFSGAMVMWIYVNIVLYKFGWSWKLIKGKIAKDELEKKL